MSAQIFHWNCKEESNTWMFQANFVTDWWTSRYSDKPAAVCSGSPFPKIGQDFGHANWEYLWYRWIFLHRYWEGSLKKVMNYSCLLMPVSFVTFMEEKVVKVEKVIWLWIFSHKQVTTELKYLISKTLCCYVHFICLFACTNFNFSGIASLSKKRVARLINLYGVTW